MLKKTPVFMEAILLGNKFDRLSVGTYAREITKGLIDRHKGIVENYYNDDLISDFIEKVAVDKIDTSPDKFLVKFAEVYRLEKVKKCLNEISSNVLSNADCKECFKYVQSSLYAGELFDKYSKLDENGKNAMMERVKLILSGKLKLNDFIEEQQLTPEDEEVYAYINKVGNYVNDLKLKMYYEMKEIQGR